MLADNEVLTLRLVLFPLVRRPVTGSIREAPSEKKSLADEVAEIDGRNAPHELRLRAPAVLTSAAARTTSGCTRSAKRIASAKVTTLCCPASEPVEIRRSNTMLVTLRECIIGR
jgi:hypothetical protein